MKNTRLANVTYSFNLLFTSHFVRKNGKKTNFHHIYSDFTLIMSNFALPWVNYNNNKYNF